MIFRFDFVNVACVRLFAFGKATWKLTHMPTFLHARNGTTGVRNAAIFVWPQPIQDHQNLTGAIWAWDLCGEALSLCQILMTCPPGDKFQGLKKNDVYLTSSI